MKKIICMVMVFSICMTLLVGLGWKLDVESVKESYLNELKQERLAFQSAYEEMQSRIEDLESKLEISERKYNKLETEVWNSKNGLPYSIEIIRNGVINTWENGTDNNEVKFTH